MTATTELPRPVRDAPTGGPARPTARVRVRGAGLGRGAAWTVAVLVPLAFLVVFFAYPVAVMAGRGFVSDGRLDLSGFADVFARPRTWRIIGQTLAQAGLATTVSVLLGVPGAYVLYRRRFAGRAAVRALVTVPFVLPTVVVGVAFRSLLVENGPLGFLHLDGTFAAVVAALVFFNYAIVVRGVGGMWERLDPRAEQAARALGATPWRALRTVTLPALTPAIASAASLVFLFCATAFGTVLVLGGLRYGTVETEMRRRPTSPGSPTCAPPPCCPWCSSSSSWSRCSPRTGPAHGVSARSRSRAPVPPCGPCGCAAAPASPATTGWGSSVPRPSSPRSSSRSSRFRW